jgi:hypothetical protein
MSRTKSDESVADEPEPEQQEGEIDNSQQDALIRDIATQEIAALIASDEPVRMAADGYVAAVITGRRYNAGDGDVAALQAELDRLFPPAGSVAAASVAAGPPAPPVP